MSGEQLIPRAASYTDTPMHDYRVSQACKVAFVSFTDPSRCQVLAPNNSSHPWTLALKFERIFNVHFSYENAQERLKDD